MKASVKTDVVIAGTARAVISMTVMLSTAGIRVAVALVIDLLVVEAIVLTRDVMAVSDCRSCSDGDYYHYQACTGGCCS